MVTKVELDTSRNFSIQLGGRSNSLGAWRYEYYCVTCLTLRWYIDPLKLPSLGQARLKLFRGPGIDISLISMVKGAKISI